MKKRLFSLLSAIFALFMFSSCGDKGYVLNEETFFLVMTNMQYYAEQYVGKPIEYDCFTYDLTDINGKTYRCGVRKCSAGYGCQCGKDTIIGFILKFDGDIPAPENQSEDTPDKTWVHIAGTISSPKKEKIQIYAYGSDGQIDKNTVETIEFLSFEVSSIATIEDYSNLNYYVTK